MRLLRALALSSFELLLNPDPIDTQSYLILSVVGDFFFFLPIEEIV